MRSPRSRLALVIAALSLAAIPVPAAQMLGSTDSQRGHSHAGASTSGGLDSRGGHPPLDALPQPGPVHRPVPLPPLSVQSEHHS